MSPTWTTSSNRHSSQNLFQDHYSPSSSELSLYSEVDEYPRDIASQTRPLYPLEKKSIQKKSRARSPSQTEQYRHKTLISKSNRKRHGRNIRHSSPSSEDSSEVVLSTLNKDDQQNFIALFYWRRNVIKSHFLAWKWMVSSLRRSTEQLYFYNITNCPKKKHLMRNDSPYHRVSQRNLLLKRHTDTLRTKNVEKAQNQEIIEKMEHMSAANVDCNNKKISSLKSIGVFKGTHSIEMRRLLRLELRLAYSCFSRWKSNADTSRKRREHHFDRASEYHREKLRKTFMRKWRCSLDSSQCRRQLLSDANKVYRKRIKLNVLYQLKRYCRLKRIIVQRQSIRGRRRKHDVFQCWSQCVRQTQLYRSIVSKWTCRHLKLLFESFRKGSFLAKQERQKNDSALSHYAKHLKNSSFHMWWKDTYDNLFYHLSIAHGKHIGLSSGIRRWKRYMTEQQVDFRNALLADHFQYRYILQWAFRGWNQNSNITRRCNHIFDRIRKLYERCLVMDCIDKLQCFVNANHIIRDQMTMARKQYHQKVITKSFKVWVTNTRKLTSMERFYRDVYARKLKRVLLHWNTQSTVHISLREKCCIVSKHWRDSTAKKYIKKWIRRLQIHLFESSCARRHQNLAVAIHFNAWENWRKKKIFWRVSVEQNRLRSSRDHLRSIIDQWHGVTLRKRCFRRLVKLFRKKQTRQRKYLFIRLWHVQIHIEIAIRKQNLDRIRLSLVKWKRICRELAEKRMTLAVAEEYWFERRYALAIMKWTTFKKRASDIRKAECKALSYYFRQILTRAMFNWHLAIKNRRRQEEILAIRRQRQIEKTVIDYFDAWNALTRRLIQRRQQNWTALKFQSASIKRRLLFAWLESIHIRRLSVEKKSIAGARFIQVLQSKTLNAWYSFTMKSNLLKMKWLSFREMMRQRHLQSGVTQWSSLCFERHQYRLRMAKAARFYNICLMRMIMHCWQDAWCQTSVFHHNKLMATQHIIAYRLTKALSKWQTVCQELRIAQTKTIEAIQFHTKSVLLKQFKRWGSQTMRHQIVLKRKLVKRLWQQILLSRAFKGWKRYFEMSILHKTLRIRTNQLRTMSALCLAFRKWRRYCSKRFLYIRAYNRLLLRKILLGWKSHCDFIKMNVSVSSQCVSDQLYRAIFLEWKALVSNCQQKHTRSDHFKNCLEKQIQLKWVLHHHWKIILRRSYSAWKKLLMMKQAQKENEMLAIFFNTQRLLVDKFNKWSKYVMVKQSNLARVAALLRQCQLHLLSRGVRKWRRQAVSLQRQRQNEKRAVQLLLKRQRLAYALKQLWTWKTSRIRTRNQAKKIQNSRVMASCFQCWQQFFQSRLAYAQSIRVHERVQRKRFMLQWKKYWQQRRVYDKKRLQARVFRCVFVEQSVLTTWRYVVQIERKAKAALAFNTAKILDKRFSIWKSQIRVLQQMKQMSQNQRANQLRAHFETWMQFVATTRQMHEKLIRVLRFKINHCVLRVWLSWRQLVHDKRQKQLAVKLAAEFYKRFLTSDIVVVWKMRATRWHRKRILMDQALLQWRNSLLCQSFQSLVLWKQVERTLKHLHNKLVTWLSERHKRHVISNLRALCMEVNRKRNLHTKACIHWKHQHQQKYWRSLVQWFHVAQDYKFKCFRADTFTRSYLMRRYLRTFQAHIYYRQQQKEKISSISHRYYLSVVKRILYQWNLLTDFRIKFRALRHKTLLSQRRQGLQQWHQLVITQSYILTQMHHMAHKRRRRELVIWFNHWESVCTDQWLNNQLIAYHQRHAQRDSRLRHVFKVLKLLLSDRHDRKVSS